MLSVHVKKPIAHPPPRQRTRLRQSAQPQDAEEHVASEQVTRHEEHFAARLVQEHIGQQQERAVYTLDNQHQ